MCCTVQSCDVVISNNRGARLEIVVGEFIEYTPYFKGESVGIDWKDMDLTEHGEIAAWDIWKESWISLDDMSMIVELYDRRSSSLGVPSVKQETVITDPHSLSLI